MSSYWFLLWDPLNPEDRLCLLYLLGSVLMIWGAGSLSVKAFQRWLRDPEVRRGIVIDGLCYPAQKVILWAGMSPVFILLSSSIAAQIGGAPSDSPMPGAGFWLKAGIEFLALDLAFFIAHVLQHQVPALWAFHEVHHSAERLNPLTAFRVHPVDDLVTLLITSIFLGGVDGLWRWAGGAESGSTAFLSVNPILVVFYFFGFNLRHSEIPIRWSKGLSRILMNPCQHQWHHSIEEVDHRINFGFALTLWDQLYGTYRSAPTEGPARVGVQGVRYPSLWALFARPWHHALRAPRGVLWVGVLAILGATVVLQSWAWRREELRSQSVFLEDIRSVDVARGIASGKTTLIIPTAGIEQNGEHLFLGKHGAVIHYAAGRLAESLGSAYVAPVVPYVPNGKIDPPEGHMRYPGSFSIEPESYETYLESIVKSARVQGFRRIILLHAHGDSEPIEDRLAKTWSARWQSEGISLVSADSYYDDRRLRQALKAQGYSEDALGHHGGLIDTAEVWAAAPEGIWLSSINRPGTGHDGDPSQAQRALGDWIIQSRIDAVLKDLAGASAKSPE